MLLCHVSPCVDIGLVSGLAVCGALFLFALLGACIAAGIAVKCECLWCSCMHESSLLQTTQALVVGEQVLECVSSSACAASGVCRRRQRNQLLEVNRRNYVNIGDQRQVDVELNNQGERRQLVVNGPAEEGQQPAEGGQQPAERHCQIL